MNWTVGSSVAKRQPCRQLQRGDLLEWAQPANGLQDPEAGHLWTRDQAGYPVLLAQFKVPPIHHLRPAGTLLHTAHVCLKPRKVISGQLWTNLMPFTLQNYTTPTSPLDLRFPFLISHGLRGVTATGTGFLSTRFHAPMLYRARQIGTSPSTIAAETDPDLEARRAPIFRILAAMTDSIDRVGVGVEVPRCGTDPDHRMSMSIVAEDDAQLLKQQELGSWLLATLTLRPHSRVFLLGRR
jgi:hypothetical protein